MFIKLYILKLAALSITGFLIAGYASAKPPKWARTRITKNISMDYPILPLRVSGHLRLLIKQAQRHADNMIDDWGNRGIAYDLNGDSKPEFLIPIACAAVGNCEWGIFQTKPRYRYLGKVYGKTLYLKTPSSKWPSIITYWHESVSDGWLANYCFRKGRYSGCSKGYYVSAYKHNEPRFMYTKSANCK